MIHLDLFSGIGGFSIASDAVWGKDNVTHIFCDNEPFSQTILKKHWPQSQIWGDIRTLTAYPDQLGRVHGESQEQSAVGRHEAFGESQPGVEPPFILTGGFPCQPFSQAGRRKGTADDNGNGNACNCGNGCGIIGVCNGDTTTSVRDAVRTPEGQSGAGIAVPVRPNTKQSGEQKISNENERTTGIGTKNENTRFTNDMEGNASVAGRQTSLFSQSTTGMEGGARNAGNTTAKLGNSSSRTDTQRLIKSSASTATTQSTTSEPALINGERVYLLTGGFPCQPFSQAGRRKGTEDERHLWPEMLRVIRQSHPRWIVGENVGGLVTWNGGMVLDGLLADLEAEGYEIWPFIIPAVAKNAPHRRDRVWIVGNAQHDGLDGAENGKSDRKGGNRDTERKDELCQPERTDSLWESDDPNASIPGLERGQQVERSERSRLINRGGSNGRSWDENWLEVAAELCIVDDGLSDGLARPRGWRNAALKGAGNAIVPQVAIEIMKGIKFVEENI